MLRPRLAIGGSSTYTVLGIAGYACASLLIGVLAEATSATLVERAIAIITPPFGFWFAVAMERRITGVERIVCYRAALAAWSLAIAIALVARARVMIVCDLAVVLIASFLAFGRLGCFHVGCCHGRPARFGVRYTAAHARAGFPRRWVGKPMFPVQLVEAGAAAALAIASAISIATRAHAGTATSIIVAGYAAVRFVLELFRGDAGRPHALGVSEAQWWAVSTSLAVAIGMRSPIITASSGLLVGGVVVLVWSRTWSRALRRPDHVDEVERACRVALARADAAPAITSVGLRVSVRSLNDGTIDVIWSHERLTASDVQSLARDLAFDGVVIPTSSATMFHVVVARNDHS